MTADKPEDLARAGVEHLQTAAREVIKATRSLLDAAEEVVDDPAAVQSIVRSFTSVAQAAASRLRAEAAGGDTEGGSDPDDGHVQKIEVS